MKVPYRFYHDFFPNNLENVLNGQIPELMEGKPVYGPHCRPRKYVKFFQYCRNHNQHEELFSTINN